MHTMGVSAPPLHRKSTDSLIHAYTGSGDFDSVEQPIVVFHFWVDSQCRYFPSLDMNMAHLLKRGLLREQEDPKHLGKTRTCRSRHTVRFPLGGGGGGGGGREGKETSPLPSNHPDTYSLPRKTYCQVIFSSMAQ